MIKKNTFGFFLLLSLLLCFSNCRDDPFGEDDANLEDLLYNYGWMESFPDSDGGICFHEIYFDADGYGHESYEYENPWYEDEYYEFEWNWNEDDAHTIDLYYDNGTDGVFRNIWIDDDDVLSGILNGNRVYMR